MTLSELASLLAEGDVRAAFGILGSGTSWPLQDELKKLGIPFYAAAHESAAAIMAGTFSRVSGRLGAALCIKGPGFANLFPGMAFCEWERFPMVAISEAYSDATPSFRMHKRLDHRLHLAGLCRGVASLATPAVKVEQLLQKARMHPAGPVFIELADIESQSRVQPPIQTSEAVEEIPQPVADRLQQAERPILILGSAAANRPWTESLANLKVPAFTTTAAKGILDENGPFAAGVFTGTGGDLTPEKCMPEDCDLVVGMELNNLEVIRPVTFDADVILLTSGGDTRESEGYGASTIVNNLAQRGFEQALKLLKAKEWGCEGLAQALRKTRAALTTGEWLPSGVFEHLSQLDGEILLVPDTGNFCTVAEHVYLASASHSYLGSSCSRFMGAGIPMALGAAVANQSRPVFCAVGDGGMHNYPAEIKMAVEKKLPICFLFCCDGRYGCMVGSGKSRGLDLDPVSMSSPSWAGIAAAMGCPSVRVSSQLAFEAEIANWRQSGPLFLELAFDPETYATMTSGVR